MINSCISKGMFPWVWFSKGMISMRKVSIFRKCYSFHLVNGTGCTLRLWKFAEMMAFLLCSGDLLLFYFFIPPFILYGHLIPSFWCLLTTVSLKNPYLSEMTQCENRIWITPLLHSTCWSNNLDKWNKLLKWRSGFFFSLFFFLSLPFCFVRLFN